MRFIYPHLNVLPCGGAAVDLGSCYGMVELNKGRDVKTEKPTQVKRNKPNVVFVFGDQWRAQATGYAGDPNVKTPNIDRLASESLSFTNAVAGCPVCSPYRASLITGQRPLTHGIFMNDLCLRNDTPSVAEELAGAGYDTAYIGKWHLDGHGRSNYIPRERRHGFDYWKALECTHTYNHSAYYADDSDEKLYWDGYDAIAQTRDAADYIRGHQEDRPETPFSLVLSWGPPHAPYDTAPDEVKRLYAPEALELRPNVPESSEAEARKILAGYYAHCTALDSCVGELINTIRKCGIEEETLFVFTSDHGDMLGSQGHYHKQRPWDESIRVPFLLRWPGMPEWTPGETDALIDAQDIMPTLLSLCGIPVPEGVEGIDFSGHIAGGSDPTDGAALLTCPHPFGQWLPDWDGGKEYRGLRTKRYTYVRDLDGPWLLYDNEDDPFQLRNLIESPRPRRSEEDARIADELDERLQAKLDETGDELKPGMEYVKEWGYEVDETGTVPYVW